MSNNHGEVSSKASLMGSLVGFVRKFPPRVQRQNRPLGLHGSSPFDQNVLVPHESPLPKNIPASRTGHNQSMHLFAIIGESRFANLYVFPSSDANPFGR